MVQDHRVNISRRYSRWKKLPGIVIALFLCVGFMTTTGASMAQTGPGPRPDEVPRYYDPEDVFPDDQRAVLASDADRLTSTNIPILVYVRTASANNATEEQSRVFANSVQTEWAIATEPGADDGMVILLSWVPDQKDQSTIVISWGQHTFDESGLTPDYVNNVLQTTMRPFLEDGRPFEAMYAGMREIRYGGIYFPPPVAPLTTAQNAVHETVNVVGPVAVIAVPLSFVYLTLGQGFGTSATRKRMYTVTLAVLALVTVLAIVSVFGRSGIGIVSAMLILTSLAIQVWLWTHPSRKNGNARRRAVPPTSQRARKRRQARDMTLSGFTEVTS